MKSKRFAVDFLLRKYTPRLGWDKTGSFFREVRKLRLRFLLNGLVLARIQKNLPFIACKNPNGNQKKHTYYYYII